MTPSGNREYVITSNQSATPQKEQHTSINAATHAKSHDVTLQTLDADLRGTFYAKEAFEQSLNLWDGLPLVFAKKHPDFNDFERDQSHALKDINGKIVGSVTKPFINLTGHPRLMGKLDITDPEIDKLITNGAASVSTAFAYEANTDNVLISIQPNHVLIFQEDRQNYPKDRGSLIMNKEDDKIPYLDIILSEVRSFFTAILAKARDGESKAGLNSESKAEANSNKTKEVWEKNKMDKVEELAVELQAKNIELATTNTQFEQLKTSTAKTIDELNTKISGYETAKTALESKLGSANEQITAFEKANADALTAQLDGQWDTLKKEQIPPGMTNKDEDEKALHTLFTEHPYEFITRLVTFNKVDGTNGEGEAYNAGGSSSIIHDVWNPETGKFEVSK